MKFVSHERFHAHKHTNTQEFHFNTVHLSKTSHLTAFSKTT